MSKYESCVTCNPSEISLEELLKGLFVEDADGNIGIELKINPCDPDNVSAVQCDLKEPTLADLLKLSMVIDECDKCSLKVFVDASALEDYICEIVDRCVRQE